jgi:4-amino-4-deoxy-L-arabinose transferase-like glycosyltransferase
MDDRSNTTGPSVSAAPGPAAESPDPKIHMHLAWILFVGALLRLGLWLWSAGQPLNIWDERDYNTLAVNLVRYHEFAFVPGTSVSLRPPLYPAVVAVVYDLFGLENYQSVRLLQAVLSLLNVLLLYRLGAETYSRRVGVWLAGLFGVYPSLLGFNNLLLTEVQFTVLLCGFCSGLARALRRESYGALGLAGVLLGLAALTRSVLWLFPPVLSVFLLLAWPGNIRRRLRAVGSLIAPFCLVMAPWAIRNTNLEKTFQAVDCMGGRNFMMGNYEYTPLFRAWDTIAIEGKLSWHQTLASADLSSLGVTQGQRDKRALRHGLRFVLAHPWLTVKRDLVKFFDFWNLERELVAGAAQGFFGKPSLPALLLLTSIIFGSYATSLISGIFGALMAPPADWRVHWFLLLVIGFICGMHTLSFGHSRYHLPIMPLVLLYSAAAIVDRRAIWSRRGEWPFRVACCLSAIFVMGWLWQVIFVDFDRYLKVLQPDA